MADKQNKTKLKKFFEENRTLMFTIPVFLVLVVAVILVYALGGSGEKTAEQTPTPTQEVSQTIETQAPSSTQAPSTGNSTEGVTLPQSERDKDSDEISRNPFTDPYRVSGIIYDKSGNSLAIIEAENKSFIVETGENVGGYFKVIKIEENKVVLEVEGKELVLSLSSD